MPCGEKPERLLIREEVDRAHRHGAAELQTEPTVECHEAAFCIQVPRGRTECSRSARHLAARLEDIEGVSSDPREGRCDCPSIQLLSHAQLLAALGGTLRELFPRHMIGGKPDPMREHVAPDGGDESAAEL